MRKQDIKPGVVYAYQPHKDYNEPVPIVFLATPADGLLFSESRGYGTSASSAFRQTSETKPRRAQSFTGSSIGYPAVMACNSLATADLLDGYTLADFEAARSMYLGDVAKFVIITNLGLITGTYDDAKAEYGARQEDARVQRQQDIDRKAERDRRASAVIAAFASAGVKALYLGGEVALSLDDAEKLAALLPIEIGRPLESGDKP